MTAELARTRGVVVGRAAASKKPAVDPAGQAAPIVQPLPRRNGSVRGDAGTSRAGQAWTVGGISFCVRSWVDGTWFTIRAGAVLSRQMAPVRLGSDLAGCSGRFWFGLLQVKARATDDGSMEILMPSGRESSQFS